MKTDLGRRVLVDETQLFTHLWTRLAMKSRAVIKQSDGWWIGWLVDLPGVNAQERTREELMASLRMGAEDMLATQISFEPQGMMTVVDVPVPAWAAI